MVPLSRIVCVRDRRKAEVDRQKELEAQRTQVSIGSTKHASRNSGPGGSFHPGWESSFRKSNL